VARKQLFTSYFARYARHPLAVAITVARPAWAPKMLHCKDLAPVWGIVRAVKSGRITSAQYTEAYLQLLKERNKSPQQVVDALPDRAVLLCYCSPGSFCHRHVAGMWLSSGADVEVVELS